jgi:fructosamine-3-kinase
MVSRENWLELLKIVSPKDAEPDFDVRPVSGGDINEAYRLQTSVGIWFVKWNNRDRFPGMFDREAEGLGAMAYAGAPVPEVVYSGETESKAFLILKFIEEGRSRDFRRAGRMLARLHQNSDTRFGWDTDNYIGSLPQYNDRMSDWSDFYREMRLEVQLKLASDLGRIDGDEYRVLSRAFDRICSQFPVEPPAFLHGDLWSGNQMFDAQGDPVFIDPAVYYGHREMDLGMTRLFGGFPGEFYDSYNEVFPLENGWAERMGWAQLYPLLVHVNLFGRSYLGRVMEIVDRSG